MKEQQKRKIQQFHPEIEDGTDLRRWPLIAGVYTLTQSPIPRRNMFFFKLSLTYRGFASFHSQHLLVDRGYLIC